MAGSEIAKGARQLLHRRLAVREPGENGAANRIGERCKGVVEGLHI